MLIDRIYSTKTKGGVCQTNVDPALTTLNTAVFLEAAFLIILADLFFVINTLRAP